MKIASLIIFLSLTSCASGSILLFQVEKEDDFFLCFFAHVISIYNTFEASVANSDLSPFLKVTWPAIASLLNFSTA